MFIKYLSKNRLYAFVTLTGFSVSLMFVLLLSVYIRQELSVDQFHKNKDRIYRLVRDNGATFGPLIGPLIKSQYPEVETYTRLYSNNWNAVFKEKQQERVNFLMADSSFFTMFSFGLIEGDRESVLATKNSVVLSSTFAKKIFGNENPVGKTCTINKISFTISGVFADMPGNTHIQKCDGILNFNVLADLWNYKELLTTNNNSSFGLYFLVHNGTDLPSKAPKILEQFKKDYWLYSNGFAKTLGFESLTEVYFSREGGPAIRQNSKTTVFIFGAIALAILIVAIVNYINLTVTQSWFRTKETAVRKMMGCSKNALLWQYITDSVVLSIASGVAALLFAFMAEPFFNTQMNCQLNLDKQFSISFLSAILGITVATGFISGIVPAIVVNSFKPVNIVKGSFSRTGKNYYSRILIAVQYCISIILLVSTWTIVRQSEYMQNHNPGFNKENLYWMENTIAANQKDAFRNTLKTIPGVMEVSYCMGSPIDGGNNQSFNYKGKPVSFQEFVVDSLFLNMMEMKVTPTTAARSKQGVWINKTAVNLLELGDNPVSFRYYEHDVPVLGIIDDFNFRSLHTKIGPIIVRQMGKDDYPWSIMVKLGGTNQISTVRKILKEQADFTGGVPMESEFVDEVLNRQYLTEVKQARLIGAFTLLSIIISSMGIFAMALYFIQKKVKEIGIRKINGARVIQVMVMLNKEFLNWVVIAFVVACPVAGILMHKWIQHFAYHVDLAWWIFLSAGLLAISLALLTISWQSWRAATRNPVDALRYE